MPKNHENTRRYIASATLDRTEATSLKKNLYQSRQRSPLQRQNCSVGRVEKNAWIYFSQDIKFQQP